MKQPKPIEKTENRTNDLYRGTREQLVAAGIVRDDQFPAPGRFSISYSHGKEIRCNAPKDETYLRIVCYSDGKCLAFVGVPREVWRARKEAEKAHIRNLREQEVRNANAKLVTSAAQSLQSLPRSKDEFRKRLVRNFRHWAAFGLRLDDVCYAHGFSVDPDSMLAVEMAFDVVAEAILEARIEVDEAAQMNLVNKYQTAIATGDQGITDKVAQLVRPDGSLLAGERS